jgi:hypothetical protein
MRGPDCGNEKAIHPDGFPCDSQSLASLKSPLILKEWIRTFCIPAVGRISKDDALGGRNLFRMASLRRRYTSLAMT